MYYCSVTKRTSFGKTMSNLILQYTGLLTKDPTVLVVAFIDGSVEAYSFCELFYCVFNVLSSFKTSEYETS